jgi:hypothetical protein
VIATILDRPGRGNHAIYVRLRNAAAEYWNWVSSSWVAVDPNDDTRVWLTEYPDPQVESRYQAVIVLPSGSGTVEYVRVEDQVVIGEEPFTGGQSTGGTGTNAVTIAAVDQANQPVPSVLVQAWQFGVMIASAVTGVDGTVLLGLPTGSTTLTLSRVSWGTFPTATVNVVSGAQSVVVTGTAAPPGPPPVVGFSFLIPVADVEAKLQSGFSVIEVYYSDDESATWHPLTFVAPTSGQQPHIALIAGVFAYAFLDPAGSQLRRYKWRFSANGVAPFSVYSKYVFGKDLIVAGVPTSIGVARFIGVDGRPKKKSMIISVEDTQTVSGYTMGTADVMVVPTDDYGFLQVQLVQGAKVRVSLEGTDIIRIITVPATPTFDILQAIADAPDEFTMQETAPLLTKRSL